MSIVSSLALSPPSALCAGMLPMVSSQSSLADRQRINMLQNPGTVTQRSYHPTCLREPSTTCELTSRLLVSRGLTDRVQIVSSARILHRSHCPAPTSSRHRSPTILPPCTSGPSDHPVSVLSPFPGEAVRSARVSSSSGPASSKVALRQGGKVTQTEDIFGVRSLTLCGFPCQGTGVKAVVPEAQRRARLVSCAKHM
ncbi:uncharacterized protein BDR25DRAFT_33215 [Lindgomyces ingoldianus]|uniref:Uncharacterized protein n=1 Tax=Lindgomyces ingoldianus TaxID=673940 RepID=A0ACB6QTS5_9PLEO|nr:uncharacterized protein BDR25DRAFT_33215 [Lindgomyces ingoldianus]KAF2470276.1 hypothetical protein BDR25DRAFT_33215 [Lindgomyces ingoldianus]